MKKISLLDKFNMTDKFLAGEITLVMDAVVDPDWKESVVRDGKYWVFPDGEKIHCRFSEGDILPVMMSYHLAGLDKKIFGASGGWYDKRVANPKYMPNRMEVKKVRVVRAQDLTEEDVLRAGVKKNSGGYYMVGGACGAVSRDWRVVFGMLFDLMFKVPYALNPWVVVYDMLSIISGKDADR